MLSYSRGGFFQLRDRVSRRFSKVAWYVGQIGTSLEQWAQRISPYDSMGGLPTVYAAEFFTVPHEKLQKDPYVSWTSGDLYIPKGSAVELRYARAWGVPYVLRYEDVPVDEFDSPFFQAARRAAERSNADIAMDLASRLKPGETILSASPFVARCVGPGECVSRDECRRSNACMRILPQKR